MRITADERLQRAEGHARRIEEQMIPALRRMPDPERRRQEDFQRWRAGLLRQYAREPSLVLEARLEALRARLPVEVWETRHSTAFGACRNEEEWRDVCEAVILEYLTGRFPERRQT